MRQGQRQIERQCLPVTVAVIVAGALWERYWAWADTHCWRCDGEISEVDWKCNECPHCGADLMPF